MAVDTPAKIAVLGAGPIGLEAALYARFLGYDVEVYEKGDVAHNVCSWGHVRLFSPFELNHSPLGLAALVAQDARYCPPENDALLTGREYAERYLEPLSQTDLLADCIYCQTEVRGVARTGAIKREIVCDSPREELPFRILLRGCDGDERDVAADVVIDTTGTFGNHCWMGASGLPAVGETELAGRIVYELPDIMGERRTDYAGQHTLLIGAGYSAATSATALAKLAESEPGTQVTWVTRRQATSDGGPIPLIADDRLIERDRIARAANKLAVEGGVVQHRCGSVVEHIEYSEDQSQFRVELQGQQETLVVDRVLANVGYRPNLELYSELQVHQCYATDGPMKLAATLIGQRSVDCLDQASSGPDALLTTEPSFYVLGSKSYGRNSSFLIRVGLQQIRDLFTLIGDRADLDLYAGIKHTAL